MREIVLVKLNGTGVTNMVIKLGRGVYLYRLTVVSPDGKKKEKLEKIGYSLIAYSVIQYFKTKL